MKKQRNASIELLRFLMMLGIVHVHVTLDLPVQHVHPWYHCLFVPCVVGFVFISGYYGIKFRLSKVVGLIATAGICVALKMVFEHFVFHTPCSIRFWYASWQSYWFLNAYIVLMCFAPLVNFVVEKAEEKFVLLLPILLVVYGWAFAKDVRFVQDFIPRAEGVSSYSFLTLLGIYTVASLVRKCNVEQYLKTKWLVVCAAVMSAFVIAGHGLEGYASPFALILVICIFFIFKRITIKHGGGAVLLLSASTFPIYIMHIRFHAPEMRVVLSNMIDKMLPYCFNCDYLVIGALSLLLFIVALCMDLPRRFVSFMVLSFVTKLNNACDGVYNVLTQRIHDLRIK